jgi:hypothetical protein
MPGDNGKKEVIRADQVLKDTGLEAKSGVKMGSWEQQSGLKLAWAVGALAAIVTIILVFQWWFSGPPIPKIAASLTPDQAQYLKDYKVLADDALDRTVRAFDTFVGRPLIPVFTTLIGYVIGNRGRGKRSA